MNGQIRQQLGKKKRQEQEQQLQGSQPVKKQRAGTAAAPNSTKHTAGMQQRTSAEAAAAKAQRAAAAPATQKEAAATAGTGSKANTRNKAAQQQQRALASEGAPLVIELSDSDDEVPAAQLQCALPVATQQQAAAAPPPPPAATPAPAPAPAAAAAAAPTAPAAAPPAAAPAAPPAPAPAAGTLILNPVGNKQTAAPAAAAAAIGSSSFASVDEQPVQPGLSAEQVTQERHYIDNAQVDKQIDKQLTSTMLASGSPKHPEPAQRQHQSLEGKAHMQHADQVESTEDAGEGTGPQPQPANSNEDPSQGADTAMEDVQAPALPACMLLEAAAPPAAADSQPTRLAQQPADSRSKRHKGSHRELASLANQDFYDPSKHVQLHNKAQATRSCPGNDLSPPVTALPTASEQQQVQGLQLPAQQQAEGSGGLPTGGVGKHKLRRDGSGSASSPVAAPATAAAGHARALAGGVSSGAGQQGGAGVAVKDVDAGMVQPSGSHGPESNTSHAAAAAAAAAAPVGGADASGSNSAMAMDAQPAPLTQEQERVRQLLRHACRGDNPPLVVLGLCMSPITAACYKLVHANMLKCIKHRWNDKVYDAQYCSEILKSVIEADDDDHDEVEEVNDKDDDEVDGKDGGKADKKKSSPFVEAVIHKLKFACTKSTVDKKKPQEITAWDVLERLPAEVPATRHLYTYIVGDDDPRVGLRGANGVRTKKSLRKGRILGSYAGFVMANGEYEAGRKYFGFQGSPPSRLLHNLIKALPNSEQMDFPPADGQSAISKGLAYLYYVQYSAHNSVFDRLMSKLARVCVICEEDNSAQAASKKKAGRRAPQPQPQVQIRAPVAEVRAAITQLMISELQARAEKEKFEVPKELEDDEVVLDAWLNVDEACHTVECDAYGADIGLLDAHLPGCGDEVKPTEKKSDDKSKRLSLIEFWERAKEEQEEALTKGRPNKKASFSDPRRTQRNGGTEDWSRATHSQLALIEQQLEWLPPDTPPDEPAPQFTITAIPPHRNMMAIINDPALQLPGCGDKHVRFSEYMAETKAANCAQKVCHIGGWPFPMMITKRDIEADEELSYSYGQQYWKHLDGQMQHLGNFRKTMALALQAQKGELARLARVREEVTHNRQRGNGGSGQQGSGSQPVGASSGGLKGPETAAEPELPAMQGSDVEGMAGSSQEQEVMSQQRDAQPAPSATAGAVQQLLPQGMGSRLAAGNKPLTQAQQQQEGVMAPQLRSAATAPCQLLTTPSVPISNSTQTTTSNGLRRRRSFFTREARLAAAARTRPPTAPPTVAESSLTQQHANLHNGFQAVGAPGYSVAAPTFSTATPAPMLHVYNNPVPSSYMPHSTFHAGHATATAGPSHVGVASYVPAQPPAAYASAAAASGCIPPGVQAPCGGVAGPVNLHSAGLPGVQYCASGPLPGSQQACHSVHMAWHAHLSPPVPMQD